MATLLLSAVGTALGGPIGGLIGRVVGGLIDTYALSALSSSLNKTTTKTNSTGPRLNEISITSSSEGAALYRVYGRARIGGQIIWCSQFKEVVNTTTTVTKVKSGGKGGGSQKQVNTTTTYNYFLSFAIAFCESRGKAILGRVWMDSKQADLSKYNFRFYHGEDSQGPDPKIEAIEGAGNVPAYRGTCYIMFDELPLEEFGNRMPQVTAEVVNALDTDDPDDLSNIGRAFCMIPSSGEFVYGTQAYNKVEYSGGVGGVAVTSSTKPENIHNGFRIPDVKLSLDHLYRNQTALDAISIVVAWFGTDLRADQCRCIPKVEGYDRSVTPADWAVGSYTRPTAEQVSLDPQLRPIYGGTPSDSTVIELIQYIKSTGRRVVFYPFLMMDIPAGNTLPNPYSNSAASVGQAVFPWRGRITPSPARGYTGSPDKAAGAATQVNTFFTRTEGFRAFILHYASLCAAAGGVDAFLIGSEMVELTRARSSASAFPAVSQLVTLASDVKAIVGSGTKVSYGADWTEFQNYRPSDGSNDVYFNMDPLWSSSNIDFVGIDNYMPISDWRDGAGLDYDPVDGPTVLEDLDYLSSQVEGGELYDYFYASPAARDAQVRTPIIDSAHGKDWVFRIKDVRSWWSNNHVNRPGGTESGGNTAWSPRSKPVWFTEFGCPAVNKGTNQPNVFYDPKSSESFFPYFSRGNRDDFAQRLYLEVMLKYWRDNSPASPVYGGPMIETRNMFVWTWDARPFPDYPARTEVWSDGPQWFYGHWLTGRIDNVVLARLVADQCKRAGIPAANIDTKGLYGPGALVRGFALDGVMSPRDVIETLMSAYQFDAFESDGKVRFLLRSNTRTTQLDAQGFVLTDEDPIGANITRAQETELPTSIKIQFLDEFKDYQTASLDGKKGTGTSNNVSQLQLPIILTENYVRSLGDSIIHQSWVAREAGEVRLPPSMARMDPTDGVFVPVGTRNVGARLKSISIAEARDCTFEGFDTSLFTPPVVSPPTAVAIPQTATAPDGSSGTVNQPPPSSDDTRPPYVADIYGTALLQFVDVPLFTGQEDLPWAPRIMGHASPWPGGLAVYRQLPDLSFDLLGIEPFHNTIGELISPLYSGPTGSWDDANSVFVQLYYGALTSVSDATARGSALALGVQNSDGGWEVIQFTTATLLSPLKYRVGRLLRGQLGTDQEMRDPVATGAKVVLLEPGTLTPLPVTRDLAAVPQLYRWGPPQYPQTDPTYAQGLRAGTRAGLRPYTPVLLRTRREAASGDLTLLWQRRTRFGGDGWDQAEVPLNEEFERYLVVVYVSPGGAAVRTVQVDAAQQLTYTAAQQVADFGSQQTTITFSVAQYGSEYGAYGPQRKTTISPGSST